MLLQLPRQRQLDLSRPKVMGILNITPDSFSDGGRFIGKEAAIRQARAMLDAGAAILDIGGESTRPGAEEVSVQQELDRVLPVIEAIRSELDCVISIDTCKTQVMKEAVAAGADIVNDIRALLDTGAVDFAASAQVPVCLMHMQGQPRTMQHAPLYQDVAKEVCDFLIQRAEVCLAAGIPKGQIILDPGFGFGKSLQHNYQLLSQLSVLMSHHYPVLVGMSRKSMIGQLLNLQADERLAGSLACATIAVMKGARIIRVHDVKETVQAVAVACATLFGVEHV
ncbi:dihydropteroate synthase [Rheinheimera tangshanensis]|uniref:Dihydropteroate synthase n=1 Tax=Rheinheimera tangshanensis TaxID=400153 RepID=A0A5C8LU42_9GAMM|nr:dihydropteroate synthase [Rheinheimera tangshanensis]TXK79082.1 dihydropteroate synthase [Rheinheimera tangshanensis]GGM69001.1 dihydropteroate synthase [Rheinheimera tangshanensis]